MNGKKIIHERVKKQMDSLTKEERGLWWFFIGLAVLLLLTLLVWRMGSRMLYDTRIIQRNIPPSDEPSPVVADAFLNNYAENNTACTERAACAVSEEITPKEDKSDEELVYRKKKNDRMEIALTFDDGPHPRYTPIILDILEEYGIKATFFMVGENVKYYESTAQAVIDAGHEVENHTFTHKCMGKLNSSDMRREIGECEDAIGYLTEYRTRFLRPPEGKMSGMVRDVIRELDYKVILWDVDTRDWAHTPPEDIANNILSSIEAGDIILMHDFIGHNSPTPEALRLVIPELLDRGYKFVTVSELVDG